MKYFFTRSIFSRLRSSSNMNKSFQKILCSKHEGGFPEFSRHFLFMSRKMTKILYRFESFRLYHLVWELTSSILLLHAEHLLNQNAVSLCRGQLKFPSQPKQSPNLNPLHRHLPAQPNNTSEPSTPHTPPFHMLNIGKLRTLSHHGSDGAMGSQKERRFACVGQKQLD